MITKKDSISYQPANRLEEKYFTKNSIFFDIETTGFSAVRNDLYLIGCGYRDDKDFHIVQFFAENPKEQSAVLSEFFSLLSRFDTILSFNGLGFDIPFLKAKCSQLELSDPFPDFTYIDIFKSVSKYKKVLGLPNYKQKTLEAFLNISRDDEKSGGDLIPVYEDYKKSPSDAALSLLLLHNHDDVLGMLPLIQLMAYDEFFCGNYHITGAAPHAYTDVDGRPARELLIQGTAAHPFPSQLSVRKDDLFLRLANDQFALSVPLYEGSLKYFYPDYKNYYYLPVEDVAIHKSEAVYVEKEYRTQAKASTCYTKKEGTFLPQYRELFSPAFFQKYKEKTSYFSYDTDAFSCDGKAQNSYTAHLLSHFLA